MLKIRTHRGMIELRDDEAAELRERLRRFPAAQPAEETIAVASNASTSVTFTEMQKAAVLDALEQPLEPGANEIGAGLRALRSALSDEREH